MNEALSNLKKVSNYLKIVLKHKLLNQTDFCQSIHFLNIVTMGMFIVTTEGLIKRLVKGGVD